MTREQLTKYGKLKNYPPIYITQAKLISHIPSVLQSKKRIFLITNTIVLKHVIFTKIQSESVIQLQKEALSYTT